MAEVPFTLMVRDQAIEINLDIHTSYRGSTPRARFTAVVGGKPLSDYTLEGLHTKLMAETRRQAVKLNIPFAVMESGRLRRGVITGVHAGHNKPLVTWDDTHKKDTLNAYRTIYKPITDAQGDEILAAAKSTQVARERETQLENEHKLNWRAAVEAAQEAGEE